MEKPDVEEKETFFNEEKRRDYSDDAINSNSEPPTFLEENPETPKGNEQDIKDESVED